MSLRAPTSAPCPRRAPARMLLAGLLLVALLVCGPRPALAEPLSSEAAPAPTERAARAPESRASASPDAVLARRLRDASEAATAHVMSLDAAALSLQRALRHARATRHGARAACVSDLLTRMHVAARSARSLRGEIAALASPRSGPALTLGAPERADAAEARRFELGLLRERGGRLLADASRCGARSAAPVPSGTRRRFFEPRLPEGGGYPPAPRHSR